MELVIYHMVLTFQMTQLKNLNNFEEFLLLLLLALLFLLFLLLAMPKVMLRRYCLNVSVDCFGIE